MLHSGRFLTSPKNIRLSWKSLPEANAIAYYAKAEFTAVKSFITLAPGINYGHKKGFIVSATDLVHLS